VERVWASATEDVADFLYQGGVAVSPDFGDSDPYSDPYSDPDSDPDSQISL
jgi:hypothetical protein